MTSEAETQLLPGATGYRPPHPQPHTFLGDDLEEEQGNSQDADDSMTEVEPGTPGGGIIDPTVPAIPAPGTPELGNPEDEVGQALASVDPEPPVPVPVPDCVPIFHMPDSDTVRESPPTPAPPHSVTGVAASGVARPIMSLSSFPQDTGPALAEVPAPARHTQVLMRYAAGPRWEQISRFRDAVYPERRTTGRGQGTAPGREPSNLI